MAHRSQSYLYGDAKPKVTREVPNDQAIAIGDMTCLSLVDTYALESAKTVDKGEPFSMAEVPWTTDLATTQALGVARFGGIAAQRSRTTDVQPLRINTGGVHHFDCASATFELGALVGPAKQAGNLLENQKVVAVATEDLAIGRVAKRYGSATTSVEVEVFGHTTRGRVLD